MDAGPGGLLPTTRSTHGGYRKLHHEARAAVCTCVKRQGPALPLHDGLRYRKTQASADSRDIGTASEPVEQLRDYLIRNPWTIVSDDHGRRIRGQRD